MAVVCVGFILALGLGLGLPRSKSSQQKVPKPDPERPKPQGCRTYVPQTTAPRLTGNISCPVPGQPVKCPTGSLDNTAYCLLMAHAKTVSVKKCLSCSKQYVKLSRVGTGDIVVRRMYVC